MREDKITRAIKFHDRELYCARNKQDIMCIYREIISYEKYFLGEKEWLLFSKSSPYFVFALTHNWKTNGRPVDWGIEPIMARLKAMDLWRRDVAEDLIREYEKDEASLVRDRDNSMESFLYEFRDQFKKTFSDVNTSNLSKINNKEKLNGYR